MNNTRMKAIYSVALISSMSLVMAVGCTGNDSMKYKVDTSLADQPVDALSSTEPAVDTDLSPEHAAEFVSEEPVTMLSEEQAVDTAADVAIVEPVESQESEAIVMTEKPQSEMIQFSFDESLVSSEHGDMLWQHAQYLKENQNLLLEVSGHTDESGARIYNEHLSQQRAEAVAKILIEFGAPRERVKIIGYASDLPLAGASSNREHRRVELDYQDQQIVSN